MQIKLSDHFTAKKLLRFTLPSMVMMIFTSIYGMVDGYFVSNYAGEAPFAALNLIFPFLMVFSAIGFMIGAGGSALVAKTLGEGNKDRADKLFSMLICLIAIGGGILAVVGVVFLKPIAILLGATGENAVLLPYCIQYGQINLLALVPFMLQCTFQSFLVTAERPKLGLKIVLLAGFTNMIGDAVLVGVCGLGLVGAALATAASQVVGGLTPLFYFLSKKNNSLLKLRKPCFDLPAIGKVVTNGFSEFLSNISMSVVGIVYNLILLDIEGQDGVNAYGIMMYLGFFCLSVFFGYSMGTSPIVGFHFGAQNREELRNVRRISFRIVVAMSLIIVAISEIFSGFLNGIFVGEYPDLYKLATDGFRLYALNFLLAGFNVYASAFFTALNNGMVSAVISFFRTLVLQLLFVFLLPLWLGVNGVWLASLGVEFCTLLISSFFYIKNQKRYGY